MIATYLVSLLLIGLSGVMLDMHRRCWRAAGQDAALSAGAKQFARSQYRRRTQASGIIGVLGVAIGVGPLVPREPWPFTLYLAALGVACLSITVLAAMDAWATRQHFARSHSEQLTSQIKLAREMSRDDG